MAEKKSTRLAGEEGPFGEQPTTSFRVATRDGRPTRGQFDGSLRRRREQLREGETPALLRCEAVVDVLLNPRDEQRMKMKPEY